MAGERPAGDGRIIDPAAFGDFDFDLWIFDGPDVGPARGKAAP
jgi:hypothetical protein